MKIIFVLTKDLLFYLFNIIFFSSQEALKREPNHIISDPHIYSIQDFTQVKTGVLPLELNKLVQECCKHVTDCVVSLNNIKIVY